MALRLEAVVKVGVVVLDRVCEVKIAMSIIYRCVVIETLINRIINPRSRKTIINIRIVDLIVDRRNDLLVIKNIQYLL